MVLAPLPRRLAVTESCTADLVETSISWEADCRFDPEPVEGTEEEHGILAICGKYKVSLTSVSDLNLIECLISKVSVVCHV
jgi:hypothetical protein